MSVRIWRPEEDPAGPDSLSEERSSSSAKSAKNFLQDIVDSAKAKDVTTLRDVLRDTAKAGSKHVKSYMDTDRALQVAMAGFIELAASRYALDAGDRWEPGKPLKVLLAGYSGTRNTGADVRVEEMIKQFRHLFGDEHIDMSIFSLDLELTRGYFRTVKQLLMPKIFPKFLFDTVHEQHMVVACEGSMFKSKFANALSTMMVGSLGLALSEQKLAVGYGGEAGKMDKSLSDLVARYCQGALIIARNEASKSILSKLGVDSTSGTDTAWTFEAAPSEVGRKILMEAGWDGQTPIIAMCPINPFWWPVKPDVGKAMTNRFSGMYDDSHYASVYFHAASSEITDKQDGYLTAIADAVRTFAKTHDVFPVAFGSEQLDRIACEALSEKLGGVPVIVSDEHAMYEMVSAMRQSTYMLSSRYHAIVMTMPAGVASVGITMDERIRNLMIDRGTPELAMEVDDPDLSRTLLARLEQVASDTASIRNGIDLCVYRNLERMGRMGQVLVEHVRGSHPEFPFRPELGLHGDPWAHLPELSESLQALVARARARSEVTQTPAGAHP